jgi:hypothetical protein
MQIPAANEYQIFRLMFHVWHQGVNIKNAGANIMCVAPAVELPGGNLLLAVTIP